MVVDCGIELPADIAPAGTVFWLTGVQALEVSMRTAVVELLAVAVPWFLRVQLMVTLPLGLTGSGDTLMLWATKSGEMDDTVKGPMITMSLEVLPLGWPDVFTSSFSSHT